jgi:hypothetical protein
LKVTLAGKGETVAKRFQIRKKHCKILQVLAWGLPAGASE